VAQEKHADSAATLNYIDKVHGSLFEAGRTGSRIFLTQLFFELAIIFVATGAVTFDRHISLGGIGISARPALLLLGAACVLAGLVLYDAMLYAYQERRRKAIIELYLSIGFAPFRTPREKKFSLFTYPSQSDIASIAPEITLFDPLLTSLPTQERAKGARRAIRNLLILIALFLFGIFLMWVLPAIAEIIAIRFAVLQEGWNPLPILAIAIVLFLNASTLFTILAILQSAVPESVGTAMDTVFDAFTSAGQEIPPALQALRNGPTHQSAPDAPPDTSEPAQAP
jgi:hypothetical protein